MLKIRCFITLLVFFVTSSYTLAQKKIEGKVTDAQGIALKGANIILKNAEGKMLKYTITDSEGLFTIVSDSMDNILEASMMGFRKEPISLQGNNHPLVVLKEENFQLKEVTVRAEKIKEAGDTVTYLVSSFSQEQDRTIGDVLRRLPGIDVSVDGRIQYQGVDINKFYIEGHDLMGGKYGQATNGISNEDIGSVEILENHQPKQVLRGMMYSEQAAINLRLKNSSKAAWIANTLLKGGYSDQPKGALWDGELFLMKVKPSFQALTTLKSNNMGEDLASEITDHLQSESKPSSVPYLSLSFPYVPHLDRKRTMINRSTLFSSNSLLSKDEKELSFNLSYLNDRQESQLSTLMTYILPDATREVGERRSAVEHRNFLDAYLNYELNRKSGYLKNDLKTRLAFDGQELSVSGSLSNSQTASIPQYRISNNLEWIRKLESNRLITFNSFNEWESLPQHLTVISNDKTVEQQVSDRTFFTEEKAQYAVRLGRFRISGNGGLSGYFRHMDSSLSKMLAMDGLAHNDLSTNYMSLFASPEVEYSRRTVSVRLQTPLNYTYYAFSGVIDDKSRLFFSPQLTLRWKPNGRLTLTAIASLADNPMSMQDIHKGYIASDYRTLFQGVEHFYTSSSKRLSLRFSYKHVPSGFFTNFMLSKSWNTTPYKLSQNLMDDYVIYSYQASESNTHGVNGMLTISKTLDFMKGGASITGTYLDNRRTMLTENASRQFNNTTSGLRTSLYGSVLTWLNLAYNFRYDHVALKIAQQGNTGLQQMSHSFSMSFLPSKPILLQLEGEYYRNEVKPAIFMNIFLLDSKLTWHTSPKIDFTFGVTNLLNRKDYQLATYGNLISTQRTYQLRGREIWVSVYLKK